MQSGIIVYSILYYKAFFFNSKNYYNTLIHHKFCSTMPNIITYKTEFKNFSRQTCQLVVEHVNMFTAAAVHGSVLEIGSVRPPQIHDRYLYIL